MVGGWEGVTLFFAIPITLFLKRSIYRFTVDLEQRSAGGGTVECTERDRRPSLISVYAAI